MHGRVSKGQALLFAGAGYSRPLVRGPSTEASSEPLGENMVIKLNYKGEVVGLEIINLSKLEKQDLENLPSKLKEALLASLKKILTQSLQLA